MTRTCAACGAPLVRRETEKPHKFAQRLTCGFACGAKAGAQTQGQRAAVAAADRPSCVICEIAPRAADSRNRLYVHCGSRGCRKAAMRGDHVRGYSTTGWPERVAVIVLNFRPHEISPPAEGAFRLSRPLNHSAT